MPQMSPMWWMSLMILFIFMMLMFNSMIYFIFSSKMDIKLSLENKQLTWKW
uniref:ATP synthase F0 subunit 8 n=1 Tax=Concaveplana hamulusa TaxID=3092773 RepID=A0AAF0Z3C9_9HEMI|nr:ATP synthase F0 subunit 8 [Concaveplana hamulusa]WPC85250.1 ATP synthase F0 subunit 8 [Concaveplana hamulusa]